MKVVPAAEKANTSKLFWHMMFARTPEDVQATKEKLCPTALTYLSKFSDEAQFLACAPINMHGRTLSSPVESMNAADIKNQVRTADPFTSLKICVEHDRRRVNSYIEKSQSREPSRRLSLQH